MTRRSGFSMVTRQRRQTRSKLRWHASSGTGGLPNAITALS